MEKKEVKIKIDPNGNIHREVVESARTEDRKPRFLKKIFSTLTL